MRQEALNIMRKREAWAKAQRAKGLLDAGDAAKDRRKARELRGKKVRPVVYNTCPECRSGNVMYRMRADGYVCRRCGMTWPRMGPISKRKVMK